MKHARKKENQKWLSIYNTPDSRPSFFVLRIPVLSSKKKTRFHLAFLFTPHPTKDDSLRIFSFLLSFTTQVANFFPLLSHPEWPTRFLPFARLYIAETWSVNLGQSELEL